MPPAAGRIDHYFLALLQEVTNRKRAETSYDGAKPTWPRPSNWPMSATGTGTWPPAVRLVGRALPNLRFEPRQPPVTLDRAWDQVHPGDRARVEGVFAAAGRDGRPYLCTFRLRRDDGTGRVVESRGRPELDAAGKAVRMFGTIQDITELRRAEEAVRESEARFRGTFENAAVGIAHMTACHYVRVNGRVCEIVGYSHEERGGDVPPDHPPRRRGVGRRPVRRPDAGRATDFFAGEAVRAKDGPPVWVNMSVSLQRDAADNPAYAIEAIQDISDVKRAEDELRVANDRSTWPCGSDIGIWDVDLAPGGEYRFGPVRFINVWERLGYDPAEFPGGAEASRALGHPDDLVEVDPPSRRAWRAKPERSAWRTGSGTRTGPGTGSSPSARLSATRRAGPSG